MVAIGLTLEPDGARRPLRGAVRRLRAIQRQRRRIALLSGVPVAFLAAMLYWAMAGGPTEFSDPLPVWMCFNLAVVASAVLLVCRWFLLGDHGSAWGAAALLCTGVYLQPMLSTEASSWSPPLSVVDLVAIGAAIAMLRCGVRNVAPTGWRQPLLCGVGAGIALAGMRFTGDMVGVSLPAWATFTLVAIAFLVAAAVCAGTMPHPLRTMPRMRGWILTACCLVGVFAYHVLPHVSAPWTNLSVAIAVGAGSSLLIVFSAQLLHDAFRIHASRLVSLSNRVSSAETAAHQEEELMHEFRATIAGIDSATRLLIDPSTPIPIEQRDSLQRMLDAELTRLQQMLRHDGPSVTTPGRQLVDLDQLLEPLIVAQHSQGARIDAPPTGLIATCCPLEVSKAIHAVLCNAREHASGSPITITGAADRHTVTLRIRDHGPGIAPDVRPHLFTRHGKGAASTGSGLGLFSARQALRQSGGDLVLEPTATGTSFAVVLPR